VSKILLPDTWNDELFIDGPSDSLVNEKYLYICYVGVNSSYSTPSYEVVTKYEYLIHISLRHIVQGAPTVPKRIADTGMAIAKEVV